MMFNISGLLLQIIIPSNYKLSDQEVSDIMQVTSSFIKKELSILPFPVNIAINCLTIFYHFLGILLFAKFSTSLTKKQHRKLCKIFTFIPYGKIYLRLIRSLTLLCYYEQDVILNKIYENA